MDNALATLVRSVGRQLLAIRDSGGRRGEWQGGQFKAHADMVANDALLAGLGRIDGSLPVVSEELPASHTPRRPHRYFIIDPIDGTASYAEGFPGFVTQVALVEAGRPVVAAVYAPATDEIFVATVEGGARRNGQPIHVATAANRLVVIDNYPQPHGAAAVLCRDLPATGYRESGSIALKICRIADGTADLFAKDVTVRDWDLAPAALVLAEAGGAIALPDGSALAYAGAFDKPGVIAARDAALAARAAMLIRRPAGDAPRPAAESR